MREEKENGEEKCCIDKLRRYLLSFFFSSLEKE